MISFGAWNAGNDFIAGGLFFTPTSAGLFFDGPRFTNPAPILNADYEGRATGIYHVDTNGGQFARESGWTQGRTVQSGLWNASLLLAVRNGSVAGALGQIYAADYSTYINGVPQPTTDAYSLTGITVGLTPASSSRGYVQGGQLDFRYGGRALIPARTTGSWAAQSSNDGRMLGGTLVGSAIDATGRDTLTFGGVFVTERQ